MKKITLLKSFLLLCALIVGSLNGWAEERTVSWTATAANNFGATISSVNGTRTGTISTGSFSWSYTNTLTYLKSGKSDHQGFLGDTGFIQIGSSNAYHSLELTTSAIPGTINSVSVECSSASGAHKLTISVGSTKYKNAVSTASGLPTTTGSYTQTGTGTSSGTISISLTPGSGALYIKSISVTYETVTKKNTTLTLSPTSLGLTYGGSTGTLTATVTPEGESALVSPAVSWESSNTSVATVSAGVVTPIAEGTCKITATYAGDDDYNGSSAEADVTVSDTRTAVVTISDITSQKTLYIGGDFAFEPNVTLPDGISASDVTYSYVSADPSTIRINDNGTYTVLKTGSDIDITVTATPIAAKQADYKPVSKTIQKNGAYRYKKPVFTPTGLIGETTNFYTSMTLAMANDGTPTGPIYYTTNGDEPATDKSNCTLYESALTLTETTTVKARVIADNGNYSTVQSATYTYLPLYTVTFDAGSGTCATASLKETEYEGGVELPDVTPTTGWTFEGWAEDKDETSDFMDAGDTYNPTSDCTLYAIFSKGGFVSETKYKRATSLSEIKAAGTVIIVTNKSTSKLLKNDLSGGTAPSETSGKINIPQNSIFTLSGDDENGWTLTTGTSTIGVSGSLPAEQNSKAISLTSDNNKWDILASAADNCFVLKVHGTGDGTKGTCLEYSSGFVVYTITQNLTTNDWIKLRIYVPATETIYNNQPETSLDIDDATDLKTLDGAFAEEVKYTRTMGKLSTLYLPYATEIPSGMKAYEFNDVEGGVLKFTEVDAIAANKPYVLEQASSASKDFSATNVTIDIDNTGSFESGDWELKGTVEQISNADLLTAAGAGKAYIVQSDGKWHVVDSNNDVYIPAFRAYFLYSGSSSARVMDMSFGDGETTQIHLIGNDAEKTTRIYTLDGRFVGTEKGALKKGVYVVNGKKVVNK